MKYDQPDDIWTGITECVAHRETMPDCEFCEAELTARNDVIQKMQVEAGQIVGSLGQMGVPPPPPTVMLEAKIDVLLDSLMHDAKDRLRFEGEVGRRIMLMIKRTQAEVKQPALISTNGQRLRSVKDTPQA